MIRLFNKIQTNCHWVAYFPSTHCKYKTKLKIIIITCITQFCFVSS